MEVVIEAGKSSAAYWRDLFSFRGLLYFFAWRDILVRYKQTVIGLAWSLIRPLVTMIIFTIIFSRIAKLPSHGVPYPILVFSAMLPWQFFASALSDCSNSLLNNSNLLSKVYFPRLIIPISAVLVSLVDFLISGIFLIVLMAWYHYSPSWQILTLPLFTLLAFSFAMGAGLWLAALTVRYRDFRHIVPFIVQLGLYVSPVGFSTEVIPQQWRFIYSLNPMVGVIDGFRWAILAKHDGLYWPGLLASILLVAIILASGIAYFRRVEQTFADII